MKINWKLRFQNKTTLIAIIAALVSIVYKVLSSFGVVPGFDESYVMEVATLLVDILVVVGVVVDPTTVGIGDSDRAMTYEYLGRTPEDGADIAEPEE